MPHEERTAHRAEEITQELSRLGIGKDLAGNGFRGMSGNIRVE